MTTLYLCSADEGLICTSIALVNNVGLPEVECRRSFSANRRFLLQDIDQALEELRIWSLVNPVVCNAVLVHALTRSCYGTVLR